MVVKQGTWWMTILNQRKRGKKEKRNALFSTNTTNPPFKRLVTHLTSWWRHPQTCRSGQWSSCAVHAPSSSSSDGDHGWLYPLIQAITHTSSSSDGSDPHEDWPGGCWTQSACTFQSQYPSVCSRTTRGCCTEEGSWSQQWASRSRRSTAHRHYTITREQYNAYRREISISAFLHTAVAKRRPIPLIEVKA